MQALLQKHDHRKPGNAMMSWADLDVSRLQSGTHKRGGFERRPSDHESKSPNLTGSLRFIGFGYILSVCLQSDMVSNFYSWNRNFIVTCFKCPTVLLKIKIKQKETSPQVTCPLTVGR